MVQIKLFPLQVQPDHMDNHKDMFYEDFLYVERSIREESSRIPHYYEVPIAAQSGGSKNTFYSKLFLPIHIKPVISPHFFPLCFPPSGT